MSRTLPALRRVRDAAFSFAVWTVAFSLFVQIVFIPYHQALGKPGLAEDATTIAAELKAAFGSAAALCINSDDKSDPAAPVHSHQDCPFCRFAAEAAALSVPDLPEPVPPRDGVFTGVGAPYQQAIPHLASLDPYRARAPPALA